MLFNAGNTLLFKHIGNGGIQGNILNKKIPDGNVGIIHFLFFVVFSEVPEDGFVSQKALAIYEVLKQHEKVSCLHYPVGYFLI